MPPNQKQYIDGQNCGQDSDQPTSRSSGLYYQANEKRDRNDVVDSAHFLSDEALFDASDGFGANGNDNSGVKENASPPNRPGQVEQKPPAWLDELRNPTH